MGLFVLYEQYTGFHQSTIIQFYWQTKLIMNIDLGVDHDPNGTGGTDKRTVNQTIIEKLCFKQ